MRVVFNPSLKKKKSVNSLKKPNMKMEFINRFGYLVVFISLNINKKDVASMLV